MQASVRVALYFIWSKKKYYYIALFSARRISILIVINKAISFMPIASISAQLFQGNEVVSNMSLFDDINYLDNL